MLTSSLITGRFQHCTPIGQPRRGKDGKQSPQAIKKSCDVIPPGQHGASHSLFCCSLNGKKKRCDTVCDMDCNGLVRISGWLPWSKTYSAKAINALELMPSALRECTKSPQTFCRRGRPTFSRLLTLLWQRFLASGWGRHWRSVTCPLTQLSPRNRFDLWICRDFWFDTGSMTTFH